MEIEATPTYRRSNVVGEEENRESPEKFTKVGTTDNNLGPSADTESTLRVCGGKAGLQEPMEVESQSVAGEQP